MRICGLNVVNMRQNARDFRVSGVFAYRSTRFLQIGPGSSAPPLDLLDEAQDFEVDALFRLLRKVVVKELVVCPALRGSFVEGGEEGAQQGRDGHVAIGGGAAGVLQEFVRHLDGDVRHGMLL